MLVALLLGIVGCGCPEFGEMSLVLNTKLNPLLVDGVRDQLAAFAAETGRDGVCVPEVRLVDEQTLVAPGGVIEGNLTWAGPGWPLELAADGMKLRHGLCHALDRQEGLSASRPDLFPPEDVERSWFYATPSARAEEAFALACDHAPFDVTVSLTADTVCGTATVSEVDRFLAEEVYPGAQVPMPVAAGEAVPVTWARVLGGGDDFAVRDIVADGGGVAAISLVDIEVGRRRVPTRVLRITRMDPATATITSRVDRRVEREVSAISAHVQLLSADDGAVWVATRGFGTMDTRVWRVDEAQWAEVALDMHGFAGMDAGAVAGGRLYAFVDSGGFDPRFVVWDLATGEQTALPMDGLEEVQTRFPDSISVVDGAVEVLFRRAFARFDGDRWTTWDAPLLLSGAGRPGAGTRVFATDGYPTRVSHPIVLDLATGTWTVRPVCGERTRSFETTVLQVGARPLFVEASVTLDEDGNRALPIAWLDLSG